MKKFALIVLIFTLVATSFICGCNYGNGSSAFNSFGPCALIMVGALLFVI